VHDALQVAVALGQAVRVDVETDRQTEQLEVVLVRSSIGASV